MTRTVSPDEFADAAEALLGAPFRLGGRDPATGIDCVGLAISGQSSLPCGRPTVRAVHSLRSIL